MRISLISTHSFPIGIHGPETKTGDVIIMNLARALLELGHQVYLFFPQGSYCPPGAEMFPMRPSFGQYPPSSEQCESECFYNYHHVLKQCDIVHDFSNTKCITNLLFKDGFRSIIQTLMGGAWTHEYLPHNLIVWSKSHRERVLRGATDYEGTETPDLAGHTGKPIKEAHIVHGGIDSNFYSFEPNKDNYFLWMGRWHPARGYKQFIELATISPHLQFVMAGEHPDNELFEYQKNCALEAINLTKNIPNIQIDFLPKASEAHHLAKLNLYQKAKAFIYCVKFQEPFGGMQIESLLCGTPVIGNNYGSVPELIIPDVGFVCNNLQELYEGCHSIDKINPQACRDHAVTNFDSKVMAQNYLNEYYKVLAGESW